MNKYIKFDCEEEDIVTHSPLNSDVEPRIVISHFDDESVSGYIYRLEKIVQTFGSEQPILVEIDSFGGSAYGLLRLIEAFNEVENQILTYCRSKAMSAGLILFSVIASEGCRVASPNCRFMLHELQTTTAGGDIKDINVQHKELNFLNDSLMGMLAKSTNRKSRADIKELIRTSGEGNELYFSSTEAKKLSFADQVGYVKLSPTTFYNLVASTGVKAEEDVKAAPKKSNKKTKKVRK